MIIVTENANFVPYFLKIVSVPRDPAASPLETGHRSGRPDNFVGFAVWPKFGFDAPFEPAELNMAPSEDLRACRTVQEIIAVDRDCENVDGRGRGRDMRFDLSVDSRSWALLVNFLYQSLSLQEIEP
nr:hypothetical protein [uncultured Duganella sp.]